MTTSDTLKDRWTEKLLERGFTAIPNSVIDHLADLGLSLAEIGFIVLLERFHGTNGIYPTVETLRKRAGFNSHHPITKLAKTLEEKKILSRSRVRDKRGRWQRTEYSLQPLIDKTTEILVDESTVTPVTMEKSPTITDATMDENTSVTDATVDKPSTVTDDSVDSLLKDIEEELECLEKSKRISAQSEPTVTKSTVTPTTVVTATVADVTTNKNSSYGTSKKTWYKDLKEKEKEKKEKEQDGSVHLPSKSKGDGGISVNGGFVSSSEREVIKDFLASYFGWNSDSVWFADLKDKVSKFVWETGKFFLELVNRPVISRLDLSALADLEKKKISIESAKKKIERGFRRSLIAGVAESKLTVAGCLDMSVL